MAERTEKQRERRGARAMLRELASLSQEYGTGTDFVIGGGGNTSVKDGRVLHVKASGTELAGAGEDAFVPLDRDMLDSVLEADYPADADAREALVKRGMLRAMSEPDRGGRPTVEALLHNIISYRYVVHTHPWAVNALACSQNGMERLEKRFEGEALLVPYVDPGYVLATRVRRAIARFVSSNGHQPQIIFMQNHGLIVAADSPDEVRKLTKKVITGCTSEIPSPPAGRSAGREPDDEIVAAVVNAVRSTLSGDRRKTTALLRNALTDHFCASQASFRKVALPFTPDQIVYCRSHPLYVRASAGQNSTSADRTPQNRAAVIIRNYTRALATYRNRYDADPAIICVEGVGVIAVADTARHATLVRDVFDDALKIAYGTSRSGGPHPLNARARQFIEAWEVEKYRRAQSASVGVRAGGAAGRTAVVTGGAQGFGEGIVRSLFDAGYNVVIADLNSERGESLAAELAPRASTGDRPQGANDARFVRADVSDEESVRKLLEETQLAFGGCDLFVSNAGVLRAGGLPEMDSKTFDFMTSVNYKGYFICAKYASEVMKRQYEHAPHFHSDIIQINSKSGLEGSNKNFTYAGGKFGGIGLTQSFALELMPHRIKVNSICPGNFLDGPLWSDPKKGLFVQYLKAGKVPGARTTADVRKAYESKVPAGRGCTVEDVMKAIHYVVEQDYETGQAVPVTGGQVMLK
jgi:NAD(P)-dependent dehydrogenase (short-subunit alcohol dehydrogenase family)/rhamnose utilization protein RhaD (predicted bifunctional aldolase and dehydrogenase)